jgi:hypothetical protein
LRRLLPTLLVITLLGGTAAAFALTEGLKLQKGKITAARVDKVFSPTCGCNTARASIGFRLSNPDVVTVSIVSGGHVVRTLARSVSVSAGYQVWWDGKDDQGRRLKDGSYLPRVKLEDAGRTFTLPNPIALDTKRPQITLTSHQKVFSPDGDFQRDALRIRYRINEPGRALLYVNGKLRIRARLIDTAAGKLLWLGHVGDRALPPGRYGLILKAEDTAGNVSRATAPVFVHIRYIQLARHRIGARAGRPFKVRVFTDALAFQWRLGPRAGTGHDGAVRLRVGRPGWYRLTVTANGHSARAVVRVAAR